MVYERWVTKHDPTNRVLAHKAVHSVRTLQSSQIHTRDDMHARVQVLALLISLILVLKTKLWLNLSSSVLAHSSLCNHYVPNVFNTAVSGLVIGDLDLSVLFKISKQLSRTLNEPMKLLLQSTDRQENNP